MAIDLILILRQPTHGNNAKYTCVKICAFLERNSQMSKFKFYLLFSDRNIPLFLTNICTGSSNLLIFDKWWNQPVGKSRKVKTKVKITRIKSNASPYKNQKQWFPKHPRSWMQPFKLNKDLSSLIHHTHCENGRKWHTLK